MPRTYRLGRRADQLAATRERIVQATIELYTEQGISATSMPQVARRADVSLGTVINHFPTRDALEAALLERARAEMPPPSPEIFEGLATIEDRILRLSRETGVFLDRAAPWYRMWRREPMTVGPWMEAGEAAGARWESLFRAALGSLADDLEAMAVLRAVMEPAFFESVRSGSRSTEETADVVAAVITPWLQGLARRRQRPIDDGQRQR